MSKKYFEKQQSAMEKKTHVFLKTSGQEICPDLTTLPHHNQC